MAVVSTQKQLEAYIGMVPTNELIGLEVARLEPMELLLDSMLEPMAKLRDINFRFRPRLQDSVLNKTAT